MKAFATVVAVLVAVAGALTLFVVVDDRGGRFAAGASVVGFLGLTLMFALLLRSVANAHVRKTLLPLLAFLGVGLLVLAWTTFREMTNAAFGRMLGSTSAAASASTSASVSASPSAPEPPAPVDAGAVARPPDTEPKTSVPSYTEPDCATVADASAIEAAHEGARPRKTLEALAKARYPMGLAFIQAQDENALRAWLTGAPDTFAGVASRFDTVVHEGSHIWRSKRFDGKREVFPVRGDLTIETKRLTTFHRSEILTAHVDRNADPYAKTYLEGTSGAQGFATLLDEYQAYAHSLASRYCIRDLLPPSQRTSARDGILTMMYYVETYLALAREKHPKDYEAILADPGHRTMILTVWDRAEFWLEKSKGERALGISDAKIKAWVYEPSRLAELQRVRDRAQ